MSPTAGFHHSVHRVPSATVALVPVGTQREPAFNHELIAQSTEAAGGWRLLFLGGNPAADRARFADSCWEHVLAPTFWVSYTQLPKRPE